MYIYIYIYIHIYHFLKFVSGTEICKDFFLRKKHLNHTNFSVRFQLQSGQFLHIATGKAVSCYYLFQLLTIRTGVDKYYCLGEWLKHSSSIFHDRSLYISNSNAHESLPCRLVLRKNTFLLAGSIFQLFLSKSHSYFAVQDKTKLASFFPPAFSCSCTFDIISNHKF